MDDEEVKTVFDCTSEQLKVFKRKLERARNLNLKPQKQNRIVVAAAAAERYTN